MTDSARPRKTQILFIGAMALILAALALSFSSPPVMANELTRPGNPTVTRIQFSEPTNPALRVSWTAPKTTTGLERYAVEFRKNGESNWTNYGQFGDGITSFDWRDREAGATYEVRVGAIFDGDVTKHWSGTGSGTANRPPVVSKVLTDEELLRGPLVTYTTPAGKWPEFFTDADGDTLTPSVQPQYPGLLSALASTGTDYTLRLMGLNPGKSKLTYGVSDGYGGFASGVATYTIVDNPTRQVMENSPAGTLVGSFVDTREFAEVAGTPYDDGDPETDDSLTHTLHGEAATYFDMDAASALITVKQGTILDYETKTSYTGQVKWTVPGTGAGIRRKSDYPSRRHGDRQARRAHCDAHAVQRANQPGPRRDLDRPLLAPQRVRREGPCHLVRGSVSQEGRRGPGPCRVDPVHRTGVAEKRHQPDTDQPGAGRDLRGAGARRRQ